MKKNNENSMFNNRAYLPIMGKRIKEQRLKHVNEKGRPWSQQQLADRVSDILGYNVTYKAVGFWESGTVQPSTDHLEACAAALSCKTDYLLGKSTDPNRDSEAERRYYTEINKKNIARKRMRLRDMLIEYISECGFEMYIGDNKKRISNRNKKYTISYKMPDEYGDFTWVEVFEEELDVLVSQINNHIEAVLQSTIMLKLAAFRSAKHNITQPATPTNQKGKQTDGKH